MGKNKISVEQFALSGQIINRRGHPVSPSYLYRLIRNHSKGNVKALPFKYVMEGEKDRIWIVK